jgi:uncharacterized membrane protein
MIDQHTRRIVFSAMFIAIVVVATFINVPFPGAAGGLVHLGTLVMLTISMKYGKFYGMIGGGVGMFIFDVLGGWMAWAPGTLVVRLLMGYVVGVIAYDKVKGQGQSVLKNIIAFFAGLIVMVVGYYLYEAIFLTTFEAALVSIPGNLIQFAIGVFAFPLVLFLDKTNLEVETS